MQQNNTRSTLLKFSWMQMPLCFTNSCRLSENYHYYFGYCLSISLFRKLTCNTSRCCNNLLCVCDAHLQCPQFEIRIIYLSIVDINLVTFVRLGKRAHNTSFLPVRSLACFRLNYSYYRRNERVQFTCQWN